MKKVLRYFRGVGREAKRVKWPTVDVFFPSMIVVIIIAVFAGIFLSIEDYAANIIIEQLRQAFEGM